MDKAVRVTTDPNFYEMHSESVELWSPGNVLFCAPRAVTKPSRSWPPGTKLKDILDE